LAGAGAAAAGWSVGPPLVLGCVVGVLLVRVRYRSFQWLSGVPDVLALDLLLAAALLVYVASQYRLQSLLRSVFPADPRRRPPRRRPPGARPLPPVQEPRSPDLVGPTEVPRTVVVLIVLAALAAFLWVVLTRGESPLGLDPREWFLVVLVWAAGAVLAIAVAVTGWQRMSQARPEEALLYLQDQLWRETRREQSRINRWLEWARLRRQRSDRREGQA
jgi:hypothetical protein